MTDWKWSKYNRQWPMNTRQLLMNNGRRILKSGKYTLKNRQWTMGKILLTIDDGQYTIENIRLSKMTIYNS